MDPLSTNISHVIYVYLDIVVRRHADAMFFLTKVDGLARLLSGPASGLHDCALCSSSVEVVRLMLNPQPSDSPAKDYLSVHSKPHTGLSGPTPLQRTTRLGPCRPETQPSIGALVHTRGANSGVLRIAARQVI